MSTATGLSHIDFRVGKCCLPARMRPTLQPESVYNASNSNPVVTVNNIYNAVATAQPSGAWLAPQSILPLPGS